jgi:hypothetical protein
MLWRNPDINLYTACETNGGIGYLTDTNIAVAQVQTTGSNLPYTSLSGPGKALGKVTNNIPFDFSG